MTGFPSKPSGLGRDRDFLCYEKDVFASCSDRVWGWERVLGRDKNSCVATEILRTCVAIVSLYRDRVWGWVKLGRDKGLLVSQ